MTNSIEDVAKVLADAHRPEDPDTTEVFLAKAAGEVRLVEVSGSVGTSGDTGEILPFRFAPQRGIPYPSTVILLRPEEWRRVQRGALKLPKGRGAVSKLKKIA